MHVIINYKIIIIIIVYKNLKEIKFNGFGDMSLSLVVCNVFRPLIKKAITILQKQKKNLQSLL